jgi:hypothetical protein
LVDYV